MILSIFYCCLFLFFIHLFILRSTLYIYYSSIGLKGFNTHNNKCQLLVGWSELLAKGKKKYFYLLLLYVCKLMKLEFTFGLSMARHSFSYSTFIFIPNIHCKSISIRLPFLMLCKPTLEIDLTFERCCYWCKQVVFVAISFVICREKKCPRSIFWIIACWSHYTGSRWKKIITILVLWKYDRNSIEYTIYNNVVFRLVNSCGEHLRS